ncbi:uncharacterized protein BYT42DRAFT_488958 [Radiomyces spectabilis]|uniref:uncharacterized protein n=1 Tax=Radiomyces spectabilis TaxID=64574 RepID=UPI00221FC8E9|nr:uncharacterized protein BYT42DRAFT_488958 [Radiomyces spectabilis]KAI8394269.1 hypothetical protein BYT42DRAFT_488958 [Radiomyces spectabilis]
MSDSESSRDSIDDFSFTLPDKCRSGRDLMSKLILDEKRVNNILVNEMIGQHAVDQYVSRPIDWRNFSESNVLYIASSARQDKLLPPVLVKVLYTANMASYRRLIYYGLSIIERYSAPPVVLVIVIHNTTTQLADLAAISEKQPYLLELPCDGWAKSCNILNASSISDHLQHTPLNPLVALGHFLIRQKPLLRDIDRNDDITIQQLYNIAKEIFGNDLQTASNTTDVLRQIYDQCSRARTALCEDVSDVSLRKRTIDCLDQILIIINDQQEPSATALPNNTNNSRTKDWQFVEKCLNDHGSCNWESIFQLGKTKGLFKSYAKWTSAKSAYYRQKKQKQ